MDEELRRKVEQKWEKLSTWLDNLKSAEEIAPIVNQQLEITQWEREVISNAPRSCHEVPYDHIKAAYDRDLESIDRHLSKIPQFSAQAMVGTTLSTGADVYSYLEYTKHLPHDDTKQWAQKYIPQYQEIQITQQRCGQVRQLLEALKPELATEFDTAIQNYKGFMGGYKKAIDAGIALRNVLGHYKGELWERVRKPCEQKVRWHKMAARLTVDSSARDTVLDQETKWNQLQQELSKIAKAESNISQEELKGIFTRLVDHIMVVLNLTEQSWKQQHGT